MLIGMRDLTNVQVKTHDGSHQKNQFSPHDVFSFLDRSHNLDFNISMNVLTCTVHVRTYNNNKNILIVFLNIFSGNLCCSFGRY